MTNDDFAFRLTCRYPLRCEPCLRDLTVEIRAGERVAIVGRTGAGKSSVALALFRLIDVEDGAVHLDDADAAKTDLARHRAKLAIVPQDPAVFGGTVRFNLDPEGRLGDAQLLEALRAAGAADLGKRRGESSPLNVVLDSDGVDVSEGERQAVCCARGLLSTC